VTSARDEVLARVRRALEDSTRSTSHVHRSYRSRGTLSQAARADLFAERVAEYRAAVHRVAPEGVRPRVESICREHRVRNLGVPPALPDAWRPASVELIEDHGLAPTELDELDGVLTGCTLAIAETGTFVLGGEARDGRRALTLVPDLHLCVVEVAKVVELVPEAIARLDAIARDRQPITFVSGPSATSDIELSRVEGVHGPRMLEVLLVG
jgi:L-lactate dehydrogenase complex protein LldG